jgi:hypothetical protein
MALLLANVGAVWIAAAWRSSGAPDESPVSMNATHTDNIPTVASYPVAKSSNLFYISAFPELSSLVFLMFATAPKR